jgi:hypothetical protein
MNACSSPHGNRRRRPPPPTISILAAKRDGARGVASRTLRPCLAPTEQHDPQPGGQCRRRAMLRGVRHRGVADAGSGHPLTVTPSIHRFEPCSRCPPPTNTTRRHQRNTRRAEPHTVLIVNSTRPRRTHPIRFGPRFHRCARVRSLGQWLRISSWRGLRFTRRLPMHCISRLAGKAMTRSLHCPTREPAPDGTAKLRPQYITVLLRPLRGMWRDAHL